MTQHLAIPVAPGNKIDLSKIDPDDKRGLDREQGDKAFENLGARLGVLQELLYAAKQHAVLVVLQGLDTSGKDGTIRHVMSSVSPQGVEVESFKVPTAEELAHDFLWRAHRVVPAKGILTIFNRSYYEDVLVVRVHELAPKTVWQARYDQINAFESLLTATNTIVVKFYLHISKDEQRKRLLARENDKDKAWKLSAADWVERRSWDSYTQAYQDALQRCSTPDAPWYIVPADHKWYRNLVIATTLVHVLEAHEAAWRRQLEELGRQELQAIRESRQRVDAAKESPGSARR